MRNSTVVKAIYNGNGITRRWDIPFEYLDTSEIAVILTTVVDDINVEEHIPTSDYTIDISSNEVIYPSDLSVSPIEEGKKVTIHRVTDLLQKSDYTNQGALWPESVEASFDKIHQILHEQKESIDRSVKVDITGNDDPQQYFNEIIETAKLGLQKATEAIAAAEAAEASETNAAASATAAAASAASMDESVATCTEKAAEAAASAASIDEAAQTATSKAAEAVASATAAAGSATAAAGSAATAQSSATSAAGSASAAATSETNATTAATSATTAKTAAETAASNAATSATAAAGSATSAANSVASIGDSVEVAQQAAQDAQDAADSIGDAEETCTTAATNASASATAAANSATAAAGSATTAAEKAAEVIHIVGGKFGYRQEDTRYNVGDMAFFTWTMNTMYIECTTGGVTASGDLVINNPSVGDVVQDGTVVWTVRQFAGASVATDTREGITKIYGTTGNNTDGTMTQSAITSAINSVTPGTATDTTAGVTKVYTTTGSNTDGTMSQAAITSAINNAAPGTATDTTAGITKVYPTTGSNTDGTMSQSAISAEFSDINTDITDLQTDVGTAQNDIVSLGGDVGLAQSNIGILQNSMTTAQGNIGTLQTSMATAQTDITNLQSAMSMTYKAKGSIAFANLPATLTSEMLGWVYNIYDDFTTDSRFVEGTGNDYFAGENVAVVEYQTGVYKLDVLSGYIDLSNYPRVVSFDSSTGTLTLSTL